MRATEWGYIHNPVTGERLQFLHRDAATNSVSMEVIFPAGGRAVVEHRHPGWEKFEVMTGTLDLTVDRRLRQLGPGQQLTVTKEFHFPANSGDNETVVVITAAPADFAERGIRAAFGLAADKDKGVTRSGRPRDLLALALVSERGAYQIAGPPRWLWVALMTVLGWVAVIAGKRRQVAQYWPPNLQQPWRR